MISGIGGLNVGGMGSSVVSVLGRKTLVPELGIWWN